MNEWNCTIVTISNRAKWRVCVLDINRRGFKSFQYPFLIVWPPTGYLTTLCLFYTIHENQWGHFLVHNKHSVAASFWCYDIVHHHHCHRYHHPHHHEHHPATICAHLVKNHYLTRQHILLLHSCHYYLLSVKRKPDL